MGPLDYLEKRLKEFWGNRLPGNEALPSLLRETRRTLHVQTLLSGEERDPHAILRALARWYAIQAMGYYLLARRTGDEALILQGVDLAGRALALLEGSLALTEPGVVAWEKK